eukprot:703160-Karenia_brevis.AAC.1
MAQEGDDDGNDDGDGDGHGDGDDMFDGDDVSGGTRCSGAKYGCRVPVCSGHQRAESSSCCSIFNRWGRQADGE